MADPLSIAASVVAVTTATLHTVRHVKEFIENIEKCPKEVLALIQELNVFHGSLHSLENILAGLGPDFEADEADDLDRVQPLQTLRSILQQCQETCETIESTLQPFVVKAKGTKQSKWKHSFKWATSEKSLMKIKGDILSYKVSIDTAASLASLLSTKLSAIQLQQQIGRLDRRLREDLESMDQGSFAGSSAVTSDPGLIMRRFLRDRESVLDPVNEQAVILTEADAASLSANNVGELELNLMEDIQSPVSYAIPRSAEAQRAEEGNRAKSKQSYAEIQISYGTSDCSIQNIIFRGENMTNAVISWVFNSRCSCFDQDGRILLSIPVTVPDVPKLTQERRSDLPMSTSWRNGDVVWVKQEVRIVSLSLRNVHCLTFSLCSGTIFETDRLARVVSSLSEARVKGAQWN